jgi:hypothetical protein
MNIRGWSRVFVVYAVLTATVCFYFSADDFQTTKNTAMLSSYKYMERVVLVDRKETDEQKIFFSTIKDTLDTNLTKQPQVFFLRWAGLLFLGTLFGWVTRFIVNGFKGERING